METISESIIEEIDSRAVIFALDNLLTMPNNRDILMIKNAMLIGASIALEKKTNESIS